MALRPSAQRLSRQLATTIDSVARVRCRPKADLLSALSCARSVAASFRQRRPQPRSESIRGSNRPERLSAAKPTCHLLAKPLLTLAVRKRAEAFAKGCARAWATAATGKFTVASMGTAKAKTSGVTAGSSTITGGGIVGVEAICSTGPACCALTWAGCDVSEATLFGVCLAMMLSPPLTARRCAKVAQRDDKRTRNPDRARGDRKHDFKRDQPRNQR